MNNSVYRMCLNMIISRSATRVFLRGGDTLVLYTLYRVKFVCAIYEVASKLLSYPQIMISGAEQARR